MFVDDAVDGLILASQTDKTNGETFFAVSDIHYSVDEIARQTVKYIGAGNVKYVDWPAGRKITDVGDAVISNKKIKEYISWSPQYNLESGLVKTKEYYESRLDKYLR